MRSSNLLLAAAVTGLLAGAQALSFAEDKAPATDATAHDKNACKGKDGCKEGMKKADADKAAGDKEKDACKGKDGCKAEHKDKAAGDKDKDACKGKDGCKADMKKDK